MFVCFEPGPSGTPEGTPGVTNTIGWGKEGMDAMVLLDALAVIMGHEEKELCKPGRLALVLILQTAFNILGSKERVSQSQFIVHFNVNTLGNKKLQNTLHFSGLSYFVMNL